MAAAEIGRRIRKARQVAGMTQAELAGKIGVSESTVANWEKGRHFPLRYLGKIEEVLGIDLESDGTPGLPPDIEPYKDVPEIRFTLSLRDDEMPEAVRLGWVRAWIRAHPERRRMNPGRTA
jgi:transcriptional regulator with XRE-family HTH domain